MIQKQIATAIMAAIKEHEASYDSNTWLYTKDLDECFITACKDLPTELWYVLSLANHWSNDLQGWCEDILADKKTYEPKPWDVYPNFYTLDVSLSLTDRHLEMLARPGTCDVEASIVVAEEIVQLNTLDYNHVIQQLAFTGAWSEEELRAETKDDNFARLVKTVAGYIEDRKS